MCADYFHDGAAANERRGSILCMLLHMYVIPSLVVLTEEYPSALWLCVSLSHTVPLLSFKLKSLMSL